MPANSWHENDSYNELDALGSLLSELSEQDSDEIADATPVLETALTSGYKGRRRKAAVVLTMVWGGTIALHLVSWGAWLVLGMTTVFGIHALRLVLTRPHSAPEPLSDAMATCPYVSLVVAAKNEEAVIGKLVEMLCQIDYPSHKYEVWVIDDNSTDKTPILLNTLAKQYNHLKVLRRADGATGGKSGALNDVLPLTKGEFIAVFDADAQVSPDLLRQVLPLFDREEVGAVQMRKAIANANTNFWTSGQMAEMALDSYMQQQRIASGGLGDLRGNGQFVRREALERCGGWNEETITDDLDLALRLHLDRWDIESLSFPPVQEEGVTNAIALWHQRNRWAEGQSQRYLDYWRLITRNRMGTAKTFDLAMFLLIQQVVPLAAVPDLMMAVARNRAPILAPMTALTLTLSVLSMFMGLKRERKNEQISLAAYFVILLQTLRGTIYMLHWLVVMIAATTRMSVRPKRLKWVKTVHQGK
ncbi:glycosyltransferase [Aliterella atlantica]|uniref:Beta-monoglucosyldiacylglycerol synthase n=1 Tax=Aliterella atlantica CENA595 TaxID=1618023 RepID=A0A0D8ZRH0_9CYAN|nr:glycosyltransferase family 2 protein [Aliterella atlantica]KJH71109.1 glycosyl transferase [Aliterella atlantica CENA595]